jgi:predicted acetyltransferase
MTEVFLAKPALAYRDAYVEMMAEWDAAHENIVPWVLKLEYKNFSRLVAQLSDMARGAALKGGQVRSSTFWLLRRDGTMLGASNLRHVLNDSLYEVGGHIGYGIRPSERRKGYATRLLALSLAEARKLGIRQARLSCDRENTGSEKVILKNGGVFDSEILEEGRAVRRFWVPTGEINVNKNF